MGKWCLHASMFIIDQIFVKLAGNQDRDKISDKFKLWPDQTSHFGVICPWLLKKAIDDIVQGIDLSFFIRSLWNLQITWAGITSHKGSIFARLDYLLWSYLPWLLKRRYLTFWACWTQVSDRCPLGVLSQKDQTLKNLESCPKWAPSSEFVSSSIPSWQILTAHAQPFRGARDLAFCLKVPLDSLLVWASSGGSGETARMRRLAWTFAARIADKYQIRLMRPK